MKNAGSGFLGLWGISLWDSGKWDFLGLLLKILVRKPRKHFLLKGTSI